jgi:hypothetical protein
MPRDDDVGLRVGDNRRLAGKLEYPLDVKLTDCAILFGQSHYELPAALAPGDVVTFDELPPPKMLIWQLTEQQTIDGKDTITPWDPRSTDAERILRMIMFHDAAGGERYTGLSNRLLAELDLSGHLNAGRAILVGRADRPLTMSSGGESLASSYDQSHTFCRIVLPVARAESNLR